MKKIPMKTFEVVCLEKFVVQTTYQVIAANETKAKELVTNGEAAYDSHEIVEGDEEFLCFVSTEEIKGAKP